MSNWGEHEMKVLKRVAISLTVLISLSACAAPYAVKEGPAENFSFRRSDFDLRYAWKTSQTDQGVRIDGLVKNVRYPGIENVEIKVSLLDKTQKIISEGVAFPLPQPIPMDEYRSFGLLLKNAKLSEGDLLGFQVNYNASEGQNAFSWKSSFTVKAATGAAIGFREKAENQW